MTSNYIKIAGVYVAGGVLAYCLHKCRQYQSKDTEAKRIFVTQWNQWEKNSRFGHFNGRLLFFQKEAQRLKKQGIDKQTSILIMKTKWRNLNPAEKFEWKKKYFYQAKSIVKN